MVKIHFYVGFGNGDYFSGEWIAICVAHFEVASNFHTYIVKFTVNFEGSAIDVYFVIVLFNLKKHFMTLG